MQCNTEDGQIQSLTSKSQTITDAIVESLDIASAVSTQNRGLNQ
jgi:hypothetical protein